ncbi:cysteine desulfurase family protein [Tissierella sp. Yu-01]|uniref:cysteine desulfurase family protein n=1 Tax=Tissierella sp. Yu-01 TaxID=3035694 RepID=UPI00240DB5C1|nr:cysteine desulfurase family protein [Tissierella sp. Yu-01]WFA09451.1 cysteine desulfurase family protein [Tissierella sp. Yu-01]
MIYLDNCATTKPRKEVVDAMADALANEYGNPSSLHRLGLKTEKRIKEAREIIANYLRIESKELYFTSGGTESNNIAIQSIAKKFSRKGKHIITTKFEHPSILNVFKYLEDEGFNVSFLDVDQNGYIDLDTLAKTIKEDTILVSIIHVNNEIGSLQDIKGIKEVINNSISKPILHVDGIQSFGKVEFSLKALDVDTYSFSGHKVYGPKGIGGLYINKRLKLNPIVFGGNQESGLRSGTENVPGIIGLGEAVKILTKNAKMEAQSAFELKRYMASRIINEIDDVKINTSVDNTSSPYILSITFRGTRGEVLLHYLEEKDIYVSTSSACSSKGTTKSHVLKAINLCDKDIEGTIRFCLSYEISKEDIDYTIEQLKYAVNDIRSIMRR